MSGANEVGGVVASLGARLFSGLNGVAFGDWQRLLRERARDIDAPYWPRAALLTGFSLLNSLIGAYEDRRYPLGEVRVPPPLFILGHYRSGTTHLHNLFAVDERLAFPNLYQTLFPHTFLSTEGPAVRLAGPFLPETRLVDNVAFGFDVPMEDEYALCVGTLVSPFLGWSFARHWEEYARYFTLRQASAEEVARWKAGFLTFLKKLTLKYERPLVLKSPLHTCRLRLLLELFPDARFVHIHRDPYVVYQSTLHYETFLGNSHMCLQRPEPGHHHEWILRRFRWMYDAYFEERALIPEGNLCEIAFSELERNPVGALERAYAQLRLGPFEELRPRLEAYLQTLQGYQKNRLTRLTPELTREVHDAWQPYFEAYGYPGPEGTP